MRSLVLASVLLLSASFVVLVPSASAQPCPTSPGSPCPPPCGFGAQPCYAPVRVCTALGHDPACDGQLACVITNALDKPVCVPAAVCADLTCGSASPCVTCDPDVQNLRDCASTRPCYAAFTTCSEGDAACGHNLVCVITHGGKSACVYDPCSEMVCF
jgi:hypothetical protein